MHRRSHVRKVSTYEIGILVVCAALMVVLFSNTAGTRTPLSSSETRFVEKSARGLNIVPASCPSDPHYDGECSVSAPVTPAPPAPTTPSTPSTPSGSGSGGSGVSGGAPGSVPPISPTGSTCPMGYTLQTSAASQQTFNVNNGSGCVNGYCTCHMPVTAAPNRDQAEAICRFKGYENLVSFNTTGGMRGAMQCQAAGNGCFVNGWGGNLVCSDVTCGHAGSATCVFTGCPAGYNLQGTVCVAARICPIIASYCAGTDINGDGIGDDLWERTAQCIDRSRNQHCEWGCSGGGCLPPPAGSGNITATPGLVRRGETSEITWTARNVRAGSCRVTENNPEIVNAWTGASDTKTSSGLEMQTSYTLTCTGNNGLPFTDSVTINVLPSFEER